MTWPAYVAHKLSLESRQNGISVGICHQWLGGRRGWLSHLAMDKCTVRQFRLIQSGERSLGYSTLRAFFFLTGVVIQSSAATEDGFNIGVAVGSEDATPLGLNAPTVEDLASIAMASVWTASTKDVCI